MILTALGRPLANVIGLLGLRAVRLSSAIRKKRLQEYFVASYRMIEATSDASRAFGRTM